MKVLYVGNNNVDAISEVVKKRYTSLETATAKTLKEIKYAITRGDTIDRAVVFDSILLATYDIASTQKLREGTQQLISLLKVDNILEIVCIAQSNATGQYFLEELYEIQYRTSVHVVGSKLSMTDIVNYSMASIAQLRQTSKKELITADIYQTNDSVIWSDNKSVMSEWQQLGKSNIVSMNIKDTFRLNIALELLEFYVPKVSWEYKADLREQELIKNSLTETDEQSTKEKKPKKKNIFSRFFSWIASKFRKA